MKKLNKLIINPEKVIKNEELVNLRGGYDGAPYCCRTIGKSPESIHCWDDWDYLSSWCYVWEGFGYGCECWNANWA
jgi:hypothetical protein